MSRVGTGGAPGSGRCGVIAAPPPPGETATTGREWSRPNAVGDDGRRGREGREDPDHYRVVGACPTTTRRMPARSRDASIAMKPAASNSPRTASPWSKPCSTTSQPPGTSRSRAPATIAASADRPVTPDASAPRGSKRRSPSREVRVARRDVGWIGDDHVVRSRRHRRVPIGPHERDVADREPIGVAARNVQRLRRDVGRHDLGLRALARQRERDRARAGAEVEHAHRRDRRQDVRARTRPASRSPAAGSARPASPRGRAPRTRGAR